MKQASTALISLLATRQFFNAIELYGWTLETCSNFRSAYGKKDLFPTGKKAEKLVVC